MSNQISDFLHLIRTNKRWLSHSKEKVSSGNEGCGFESSPSAGQLSVELIPIDASALYQKSCKHISKRHRIKQLKLIAVLLVFFSSVRMGVWSSGDSIFKILQTFSPGLVQQTKGRQIYQKDKQWLNDHLLTGRSRNSMKEMNEFNELGVWQVRTIITNHIS